MAVDDMTAGAAATEGTAKGVIRRVAGPLVEVELEDGAAVAVSELVMLGPTRVPSEVVAVHERLLTVQAYEYTGGLTRGDEARPQGRALSVALGPRLLGGIFDGLLRPLSEMGTWLGQVGSGTAEQDRPHRSRTWRFTPQAKPGDIIQPGHRLGTLDVSKAVEYLILAPPTSNTRTEPRLEWIAEPGDYPADAVVARIAGRSIALTEHWPVRRPRPFARRLDATEPLHTGQRALDLLFPIAKGGTAAVPGGFGTGKTVLLQQIAKWCDADVIVYVGCGERGNEMAAVVDELSRLEDPRTGGRLAERTVVIANTSDMPMMARESSVYVGACVAEFFRDMGHDAVVIADSTSRWAEALREFASRSGTLPAEEGFPADLASSLASFYERAGAVETLGAERGSVTILGAVSPPGGDMAEPVTVHTERFVRARWTLDRDLAYARHYPAISWSDSFSRDSALLGRGGGLATLRDELARTLARADRLADLVDLVGIGALPAGERMDVLAGRLAREGVLQQSALSEADAYSSDEKTAALLGSIASVADRCHGIAAIVGAAAVEAIDYGPLLRAREEAGPHGIGIIYARRDAVLTRLDALTKAATTP